MITSNIFSTKTNITAEGGKTIKNLHYQSLPVNFFNKEFNFDIILIDKSIEFRPILVLQTHYNNYTYWDLFLKINNISNPFDIQSGDILIAPENDFFESIALLFDQSGNVLIDSIKSINQSRAGKSNIETKRKPNQSDDTQPDQTLNQENESINVNTGLEDNFSTKMRIKILKQALKSAKESGNDVLAKQINKQLQCNPEFKNKLDTV